MNARTRRDKEFWFIDVSAFQTISNASSRLNTLSLDIDDDVFLFMFVENDFARFWEMYKLSPEKDLVIKDFGMWTEENWIEINQFGKVA